MVKNSKDQTNWESLHDGGPGVIPPSKREEDGEFVDLNPYGGCEMP